MARGLDGDRERLKQSAANFRSALRSKVGDELMTFVPRLNLEETYSGGWGVDIAILEPQLPHLEIWLDLWLGGAKRRLWAGFHSSTKDSIQKVIDSYPLPVGRTFTDVDWVQNAEGEVRLRVALSPEESEYPVRELYPDHEEFSFGIYDLDGGTDETRFLARAVDFALRARPDFQDFSEIELDFLEGVPLKKRQLVYSRSAQLVRLFIARRVSDKMLVCDDCSFDPTTRLADLAISPRSLLDVHHKNPRNLLGAQWNTLTDLALLCPICHRLTHARMRTETMPRRADT
jgi:hypothetical protein